VLLRVLCAAGIACAAVVLIAALSPASVAAETSAGWAAANHAWQLASAHAVLPDPDGDLRLFVRSWAAAGVQFVDAGPALALAGAPSDRVGGGRGDRAALGLAAGVCGGPDVFSWQLDRGTQPERGDPVLYRPLPDALGPSALRIGIVVSQTSIAVVRPVGGIEQATTVPRELLLHAQQATGADDPLADPTAGVSFCHVATQLIPPALRGAPAPPGPIRLIGADSFAATLAWNADHPRDRDGGLAILRMLEVIGSLGSGGVGVAIGVIVFGGAAVHDSAGGVMRLITSPFAVLRAAVTWTFDGTGLHRVLVWLLLGVVALRFLGLPMAFTLPVATAIGVAGALQVGVGGRFRPLSWMAAIAWSVGSYAVGALMGIDDSQHVSGITVGLAILGDLGLVLGGSRLLPLGAQLAEAARASAVGRGVSAAVGWSGLDRLGGFAGSAIARVGNVLGFRPSALVPSGSELATAAAHVTGEGWAVEVAPRTVAEAVSNASALGVGSRWAGLGGDLYGVALRGVDVASWFTWRSTSVVGDLVSMQGELAEWLAGRIAAGHLTHPFVKAVASMLGHLDPATRTHVLEVALPALVDASRMSSLHSGAQFAGGVLSGVTPLPVPPVAPAPAITSADAATTWTAWARGPART
jgi:hypothetical protein